MNRSCLLTILLVLATTTAAVAQCKPGDNACWCKRSGGTWRTLPKPLISSCQVQLSWQGKQRTANVFLPPGYTPSKRLPIWFHLHGNFWTTMGGIDKQAGRTVNAADATAVWDGIVGGPSGANAIVVYPQSTGDPNQRQFWNTLFWQCSSGVCVDKSVDDVGFLEQLFAQLPGRFSANPQRVYLSGTSAGGMMVHTLLCKCSSCARTVRAAVDVLGGLASSFAGQCSPNGQVPFLMLHGIKDKNLPYAQSVVLDYVPFYSTVDAHKFWVRKRGMTLEGAARTSDGQRQCVAPKTGGGKAPTQLCGIINAGHSTDQPWRGYAFGLARGFFDRFQ